MEDQSRRPSFAREFPRDPRLDALVEAFERGDFARVRVEAPELATTAEDEAVRAAAKELASRISGDPLAKGLVVMTALLLVALSAWWIAHGHPPAAGPHEEKTPVELVK